jgi:ASC-1-like (ASCH) protein
MTHSMKVVRESFEKIRSGRKVIESRLFDEKRRSIDIGDDIEFSSNDDPREKVKATVKALYRYASFEDMFSDLPPERFGGTSKDLLLEGTGRFYSKEDQEKYGVIGIRIEVR